MRVSHSYSLLAALLIWSLGGCGDVAKLPETAGAGPQPTLPPPARMLIPTVKIAPAKGWPAGATPIAAAGMAVKAYATGLDHPRWLYVLPNGDVLVAETNAPPRPEDGKGIKGWIMKRVMKRAGAGVPSANRISLLRDADGDGVAETETVFLQGLNSPFGMTLVGRDLYVANTDAIVRFSYSEGQTQITEAGTKIVDLPGGPLNHHWTKNVIASRDGSRLYVTVGSNSNVAENGMENEANRAAILEVVLATSRMRVFASGSAQSERSRLGAADGRAVDGRQRARRARQRSRPRLPDLGAGWRVLRLALQLLRPACRHTGAAAAPGSCGKGDRAGLCAGVARSAAGACFLRRQSTAGALCGRGFRR
jgi:glucose/arabinose dehydrogenase